MNKLKSKLLLGEKIYGTLVSTSETCFSELMGEVGYGCVWIDMEHGHMSCKDTLAHIISARASGAASLVRLPQNDLTVTKKVLEMGPDAILFPMLGSAEEVRRAIESTLYPPLGTRGFGPIRAIGYGVRDAGEYVRGESLELCRFVQIEDARLLCELDEVMKIPYVDGFIIGPNDLSASLGDFLNVFGEKTFSTVRKTVKTLKENRKIVGLAVGMNEDALEKWASLSPDMIFAGADWCFVCASAKSTLETMKKFI